MPATANRMVDKIPVVVAGDPVHDYQVPITGSISVTAAAGMPDGADVCEGSINDAAVVGDNPGTISAKLRGINKILFDVWDSVNHWFQVKVMNGVLSTPLRIDPVGTTTQPISIANVSVTVTPYHYITAASANQDSQNVKNTTGMLTGISAFNTQASARFLKIYDKATAPTSADTPIYTMLIPGGDLGAGAIDAISLPGLNFANGLGFRVTTGVADSDTGAAALNDVAVNLRYR